MPSDTPPDHRPEPKSARPGPKSRRGKDPFPQVPRACGLGPGHLKVEHLLKPEDRDAYYGLLRRPSTTLRSARQWLLDRGYDVGQHSVLRHLQQFRHRVDAVREAAEISLACGELARQTGTQVLADGAMARFEMLLSQALFDIEAGGKLDRSQWEMLGKALTHAVSNRAKLEELRRSLAETAPAPAPDATPDTDTVVDRVKQILGV